MKLSAKLLLATLTLASAAEEGARSLRGLQGNGNGNGGPADDDDEEETLIVTFKGDDKGNAPSKCDRIAKAHGGRKKADYHHVINACSMKVKKGNVKSLKKNADILTIEQDRPVTKYQAPWGLDRINQCNGALDGDATKVNANGKRVFILDTGVRGTHQDVSGSMTDASCHESFVSSEPIATQDGDGHGTHVASTACGTTYGVAENCVLCAVKVLDSNGSGSFSDVISGIDWAAANCQGGCVVNMSLGGQGTSSAVNNAVAAAVQAGAVVVVAAGNDNDDACGYTPANAPEAFVVGSTTSSETYSGFSNYGSCVDVYAPGSYILAAGIASDTATATLSGTSMASPHVAGIAAGIIGSEGITDVAQVEAKIVSRATNEGVDTRPGAGNQGIATVPDDEGNTCGGPTSPPQTAPPTPPPTPCQGHTIDVSVLTDNYPSETTWQLKDTCTNAMIGSGGAYSSAGATFGGEYCGEAGHMFEFTINDSFGDGICCSYGSGSYTVTMDGTVEASGGSFASSETKTFGTPCDGGGPPPATPNPVTPAPVTPAPVTPAPTTPAPVPPTAPTNLQWTFEMNTDYWSPYEQKVQIDWAGIYTWTWDFGTFDRYIKYIWRDDLFSVDFSSQDCHTITVYDSWGDGIGETYGYATDFTHTVTVDGAALHSYPGFVGFSTRVYKFGNCPGGSTTTTVQSNAPVEPKEEPKGGGGNGGVGNGKGKGNDKGGVGAQNGVVEIDVSAADFEDTTRKL